MMRIKVPSLRIVKVTCNRRPVAVTPEALSLRSCWLWAVSSTIRERTIIENLLGLLLVDIVRIDIFPGVAVVPLEPGYLAKVDHGRRQRMGHAMGLINRL